MTKTIGRNTKNSIELNNIGLKSPRTVKIILQNLIFDIILQIYILSQIPVLINVNAMPGI